MTNPNTRTSREGDEQRQRRRRLDGTLDRMLQLRLAVPQEVKDKHPDRDFRWFNDNGNRIHAKTVLDDWDKVDGVEPQLVGTDKEGRPMKAYLCMKPIEFIREDEARKEAERKEQERGIVSGSSTTGDLASRSYGWEANEIGKIRA